MIVDQWIRFVWNLKNLPKEAPELFGRAKIRLATEADNKEFIFQTIESAYKTDPGWNHGFDERIAKIREAIFTKEEQDKLTFFLLEDGKRIVGVSGLKVTASPQFITGVCVIDEYRCRGYGKALLYASLKHLEDAGLLEASVVTKQKIIAGRYLYPKFDGKLEHVAGAKPKIREQTTESFDTPKGGKIVIDDIALTAHADVAK